MNIEILENDEPTVQKLLSNALRSAAAVLIFYCEKSDGRCAPAAPPFRVIHQRERAGGGAERGRGAKRERHTGHYKALQRVLLTSVSNPRAARK